MKEEGYANVVVFDPEKCLILKKKSVNFTVYRL